jgi:hypothetical protein
MIYSYQNPSYCKFPQFNKIVRFVDVQIASSIVFQPTEHIELLNWIQVWAALVLYSSQKLRFIMRGNCSNRPMVNQTFDK